LLDENKLAKGKKFFSLGSFDVSPNGRYLAYTTDITGFREYQLTIKDLQTGKNLPDRLGKVAGVVWASDNKTLFFGTEDAAKRTDKVWRYQLGSKKPTQIFHEKDEVYSLGIGSTTDDKFLIVQVGSKDANEVHFLDLAKPTAKLKLIEARSEKSEYAVDHKDGQFIIQTNDAGPNFRIVTAPVSNPAKENWKEVVPYSENTVISGMSTYQNFMVMSVREGGFTQLQIRDYKTGKVRRIPTADPVGDISMSSNPDYKTTELTYNYQSLTIPLSVYRFDTKSGKSKLLKQTPVLGGFKASDYISELKWVTAEDGTQVPVSMVRKKTTKPSKDTPLYLYAYGSYGSSTDPWFSNARLSLLNRGMIFAIAHIRGGGEFGRKWYEAGKMDRKINTFTDFIDCGNYLVKNGYTSHEKMIINGGSAGGLLMGAVLNMSPGLAKVAIADVPFVDVINTMLDESLPLTVGEFIEWGNPKVKSEYEYMAQYSPYDNVKAQDYPHILITTSLNDSQVLFHEPTKWCAKLRATKTDNNVLLLRCNMDAGHGGASGRYGAIKEVAFDYAFILTLLGIKK
jgi:oligopeptidase B